VKDQFEQQPFDLVICDYRLPDGTGLDVIQHLALSQQKFTPCILVSGDTSPDILQKVTESGFNLLSKPVRPAKLRSLIQFLIKEPT
jgi:CheY-like chemotaxis protein